MAGKAPEGSKDPKATPVVESPPDPAHLSKDVVERLNRQREKLEEAHNLAMKQEIERVRAEAAKEVEAAKAREAAVKAALGIGEAESPEAVLKTAQERAAKAEERARRADFSLAAVKAGIEPDQVEDAFAIAAHRGLFGDGTKPLSEVVQTLVEARPSLKGEPRSKPAVGGSTSTAASAGGLPEIDMANPASVRANEKTLWARAKARLAGGES